MILTRASTDLRRDRPACPRLSLESAGRLLAERWGLEGQLADFPSYADRHVSLRSPSGERWVLKVDAPDREADLAFENAVLEWLAERAPGLAPSVRPSLARRPVEPVHDDQGRPFVARVLSFLPGRLLAHVDRSQPATWTSLGEVLGRLARALEGFSHPRMRREHPWDLARATWTVGEAHRFPPRSRALIERLQLEFLGHQARARGLPRAVIFGDANEHNLVVGECERVPRVHAVFDFGDCVRSARVFDLAIAAAYGVLERDDPLSVVAALLEGYGRWVQPTEDELEVLFPALCMRLVVSVISSARRSQIDPENPHVRVSEVAAWRAIERLVAVPPVDVANALRRVLDRPRPARWPEREALRARRERHLGPAPPLAPDAGLQLVRGAGAFLFDERDRTYLDARRSVCHVGHCHPHVVAAGACQMALLGAGAGGPHEEVVAYAERLVALLPERLSVCFFARSGGEARRLAARIVRAATGRRDLLEAAAVGRGAGALPPAGVEGPPGRVWRLRYPDPWGEGLAEREPEALERHLDAFDASLEDAVRAARPLAGFRCEAIAGRGGQLVPPAGWLRGTFERIRAHGGLAIADEVRTGFGRVGSAWWAFLLDGAVPDVVVLGRSMGNGHPLAAVVTTREVAAAFAERTEQAHAHGADPVACAIGSAVLDVIEQEDLRRRTRVIGAHLAAGFRQLAERHPCIGEVRGAGLSLGIALVRDRASREPAPELAARVQSHAAMDGVLLSVGGPGRDVLVLEPPLVVRHEEAELLLACAERAFAALV